MNIPEVPANVMQFVLHILEMTVSLLKAWTKACKQEGVQNWRVRLKIRHAMVDVTDKVSSTEMHKDQTLIQWSSPLKDWESVEESSEKVPHAFPSGCAELPQICSKKEIGWGLKCPGSVPRLSPEFRRALCWQVVLARTTVSTRWEDDTSHKSSEKFRIWLARHKGRKLRTLAHRGSGGEFFLPVRMTTTILSCQISRGTMWVPNKSLWTTVSLLRMLTERERTPEIIRAMSVTRKVWSAWTILKVLSWGKLLRRWSWRSHWYPSSGCQISSVRLRWVRRRSVDSFDLCEQGRFARSDHSQVKKVTNVCRLGRAKSGACAHIGALEGETVAPGDQATLDSLRDRRRRPPKPREPITPKVLYHRPEARFTLSSELFLHNLKKSKKGSAAGLSGITKDHLFPLMRNSQDRDLLCELAQEFARAEIPDVMRGLCAWVGWLVRVVGEILRRLVARTIAQSLGDAFKKATARHQYALTTRSVCESIPTFSRDSPIWIQKRPWCQSTGWEHSTWSPGRQYCQLWGIPVGATMLSFSSRNSTANLPALFGRMRWEKCTTSCRAKEENRAILSSKFCLLRSARSFRGNLHGVVAEREVVLVLGWHLHCWCSRAHGFFACTGGVCYVGQRVSGIIKGRRNCGTVQVFSTLVASISWMQGGEPFSRWSSGGVSSRCR